MPEVDKNRGYHNISMQDVIPRAWHASELSRDSRAGHVGGRSGLSPDFSTRRRKVGTPTLDFLYGIHPSPTRTPVRTPVILKLRRKPQFVPYLTSFPLLLRPPFRRRVEP